MRTGSNPVVGSKLYIMRESSCEATIKTSKEVSEMSMSELKNIFNNSPVVVKRAIISLIIAIPRDENLDDWECDLGDVIFPALSLT